MVICVGMPYPNLSDIRVKLKKDFLDEKYEKEGKGLKGWDWYREEAMVAVNQSLGRVIRNINDYGIMICFGIELKNNKFLFSNCIKNNISCIELNEDDESYYKNLEDFLINLNNNKNFRIIEKDNYNKNEENDEYEYEDEAEISEY